MKNPNDNIHLIFPFPVLEEDGFAGLVIILTKSKAQSLADALRDASLLINREFFATKAQWLDIDINQHCKDVILIDK